MEVKEAEKELKKAFLDYLKVEHEFNELYEELKKEVSPEKITEAFKDVGEIKSILASFSSLLIVINLEKFSCNC